MGQSAVVRGVIQKVLASPPRDFEAAAVRDATPRDTESLDQALVAALELFRLIALVDDLWDAQVTAGRLAYDDSDEQELQGYYQSWLDNAEKLATEVDQSRVEALEPTHATEFRACLRKVRDICTPDEIFFAGPELVELRDQALDALQAGETVEIRDLSD